VEISIQALSPPDKAAAAPDAAAAGAADAAPCAQASVGNSSPATNANKTRPCLFMRAFDRQDCMPAQTNGLT
jgi:hypothetical protein